MRRLNKLNFAFFIVFLAACKDEVKIENQVISYENVTYTYSSEKLGWISSEGDSIQVLSYIDLNDFKCYQIYPLGILNESQLGREWVIWNDDCGATISNKLVFTSKTVAIDTNMVGEIIYTFYQEIGRSHEYNPCGKRYVFFSTIDGIFSIVPLDSCSMWPYSL